MKKELYFSPVDAEDFDIRDGAFEVNGTYYEYKVEVYTGEGHLAISDSLGRRLPIDIEDLAYLMHALEKAHEMLSDGDPEVLVLDNQFRWNDGFED